MKDSDFTLGLVIGMLFFTLIALGFLVLGLAFDEVHKNGKRATPCACGPCDNRWELCPNLTCTQDGWR
jgi:hypothetical protein